MDLLRATYELFGDCHEKEDGIYIGSFGNAVKATQEQLDVIAVKAKETFEAGLKTKKLKELNESYEQANQLDINYLSTSFQADKESQALTVSVLSAGAVPDGFYWLDSDNTQVPMTYAELQGLSGAILTRAQLNFTKYQELKAQIKSATTQDELDLIKWEEV